MWRKSMLAVVAVATAAVSAGTFSVTAAAQRPAESTYLPLAVGNRWELRSPSAPDPMVLEVTGRDANAFIVRWINPFVQATFRFESDGTRVTLAGLDMGQGNAPMPANTVYWDFGRAKGETWKSPVGTGEISDRAARVQTPAGTYRDVAGSPDDRSAGPVDVPGASRRMSAWCAGAVAATRFCSRPSGKARGRPTAGPL